MIYQIRKFILLLRFICLILGQLLLINGFAWAGQMNTLSPVAVVSNANFKKAFDDNLDEIYALNNKIKSIKQVYSMITELDAYPGFTRMLDSDDGYRDIGIFLVSDLDEVNKIINILPVDKHSEVCELGSGIGNVSALFAARGANVIGYEIDQKLVWLSNNIAQIDLKDILAPERIKFERANFLSKDLSKFDIIFYYWNSMVSEYKDELQNKILKELKPGALLVLFGVSKDKAYFSGLKEMTGLPGYESISAYAKVYAQPDKPIAQTNEQSKLQSFRDDLDSPDTEARLQAALALAQSKHADDKAYAIIKESAINKNLTLNERIRAARFLSDSDRMEYAGQLISDEQQFARIERDDKKDFDSLELSAASLEQVQGQIKMISGIDKQVADELMLKAGKLAFLSEELSRLSNAIRYFEGNWHALLEEKLDSEYGYAKEVNEAMIADDMLGVELFNAVDYVKAYLVCQKLISRLRDKGIIVMGGDREWFLLEAFQYIFKRNYTMEQAEKMLENKWEVSTAAIRAKEIFKDLITIGLSPSGFMSEVKIGFFANTAQQFIYRGYDDANHLEYAPGPNYDARNISIGVENNIGSVNAMHINLGVPWASKYIWASYLALHNFIDSNTMAKGYYDYFYDQQIKDSSQLFPGQRRVSYIGVWTEDLDDLDSIIETFVPLSIGLNNYMSKENPEIAEIWKTFRIEFEEIINSQNDQQLKTEFFEQARMVRFVELISEKNRGNIFYQQVENLIQKTIKQINHNLANQNKNQALIKHSPEFLQFPETAVLNSI
ncbi:MAG: hypothetical protein V1747_07900 [Candidatus Omnitrophota bacterium]